MIPPFIVCISSSRRGLGKTRVALEMIRRFRERGIEVAYVKHCHEDLRLASGDTERAFLAGCEAVALSPRATLALLRRTPSLRDVATMLSKPIIVAEGFRSEKCDFRVWVGEGGEDVAEALRQGIRIDVAIVRELPSPKEVEGVKLVSFSDVDAIVDEIASRAEKRALEHLGGENCGYCGYRNCLEAARAWLRGENVTCVRKGVRVVVDGVEIPLNRFVASIIASVVKALVSNLKGVGKSPRSVKIVVGDEG